MSDLDTFGGANTIPESGGGAVEQSAESREAQREAFNEAQRKLASSKKGEGRAKKRDFSLAKILLLFIQNANTPDKQRILSTLIAMIKDDVPVEWILAILSLQYPSLQKVIQAKEEGAAVPATALTEYIVERSVTQRSYALSDFDEHNLPEEMRSEINAWVAVLMSAASMNTTTLLEKTYAHGDVLPLQVSLASYVLQEYLSLYSIGGQFEKMRSFSQYILRGILASASRKKEGN